MLNELLDKAFIWTNKHNLKYFTYLSRNYF